MRSFVDAVKGFDEDQLRSLLELRSDLGELASVDRRWLAARVIDPLSVRRCLEAVDLGARQVLEALCLLSPSATIEAVAALLSEETTTAAVAAVVDRLASIALLVRTGDELTPNPGLSVIRYPAGLGPPVASTHGRVPPGGLGEIAGRIGAIPAGNRRATLARVAEVLGDPSKVRYLVERGPPGTRELAARLAFEGPTVIVAGASYHPTDKTSVGWLIRRGMAIALSWDTVTMPREVAMALRGGRPFPTVALSPPELEWKKVSGESVDRAGAEAARALVEDVTRLATAWAALRPRLLRDGGLGVREVKRAAKITSRSVRDVSVVIELAAVSGLIGSDSDGQVLLTTAYDRWLSRPPVERWVILAAAWWRARVDVGFAGADTETRPIAPLLIRRFDDSAVDRRRLMAQIVTEIEIGRSVPPESIAVRAQWRRPGAAALTGLPMRVVAEWWLCEASVLGLFADGSPTGPGRCVFTDRLEEAATLMAGAAGVQDGSLVVQADLTALAPGRLGWAVRAEMELLADVESSGSATVFRLSEATVRRAFDAGRSAAEILDFLQANSARALPQTLEYMIADIERRHGRLRGGAASSFVRSNDEALLAELVANRRLSRLGLRLLAPTVAVSKADPSLLIETLRVAGYLPVLENADAEAVLTLTPPTRAQRGLYPDPSESVAEDAAIHTAPPVLRLL